MLLHDRRRLREDELWDLMYAFGGGGFGPPVDLGEPVSLLTPGFIHGGFNVQRSQASGAMATALNADGVTWREVAADTARFHGTAQRLLVEGARTNGVRNPRAEGSTPGVLGSGGVAPTNWAFTATGGIAWEVVGAGVANGINYARMKFTGTSASASATRSASEPNSVIVAAVGQSWTNSHFIRLVAGSQGTFQWQGEVREMTSGAGGGASLSAPVVFTADWQRVTVSRVLTDVTTTHQQPTWRVVAPIGPHDFTIDIGWPQAEQGEFASTPILPAVGVPAAATRGRDNINAALTTLNIPESAKGTLVFSAALSVASTATTAARTLVDFNDNTVGNRITAGISAGASNVIGSRVSSGSPMATGVVGSATVTPTPFHTAMAIDGLGNARYSVNGSLMQAVTSAQTSSLLSLRLGDDPGAVTPLFGEIGSLVWYPGVGTEAHLQTLSTAGVHWFFAVSPGRLASPFAVTRTQAAGAMATRQLADGTWAEMAANTARFHGTAQRLLIEGPRTNSVRNPRAEGAVPGPSGSIAGMPTNWSVSLVGGVDWEVVGTGTANGINYVRLKYTGTSNSASANRMYFEPAATIAVTLGQTWTNTHFVRLVAGSQGAFTWQAEIREFVGGSAGTSGLGALATFTADWQRLSVSKTMVDVGVTNQRPAVRLAAPVGAYDFTIDVGWPQAEQGDFASTPILPAVGVPAAATRGADLISAPLASLGLAASGAGTTAMKSLRTSTSTGASQIIVLMDDGTGGNRYLLSGLNGSAGHQVTRTTAAVGQNAPNIASTTLAGTLYKSGIRVDGVGNASGYVSGVPMQSVTGGVTGGLTTFRIGVSTSGTASYWGEIERLSITPTVMSDAEFQAAVDAQA